MTIAYRETDPISSRWTGLGRLLTAFEVDYNFYQLDNRLTTVEASLTTAISVSSVTSDGGSLTFHMSNSTTQGPFTMPTATFRDRGTWATSTAYVVNDTFTTNGTLYRVLFDHTSSATSFSPTANDGAGHDYYAAMVSLPGNALPSGGATAQVLQKSSSTDYAVTWGYKLPTGGTQYQVLMKSSSTNQDATWQDIGGTHVSFSGSTASTLSSTNVSAAIEEVESDVKALASTVAGLPGTLTLAGLIDVQFATGDPQTGAMLYFGGSKWAASAGPVTNDMLQWDGSAWVPVAAPAAGASTLDAMTDTHIVSPARGHTLVWDDILNSPGKWVNRAAANNVGSTGSNITIGTTANYAAIKFTPTASLQIGNGGYCHPGERTTVIILTSGTTPYNITAAASVVMASTLATGTVSGKVWTLSFCYDSDSGNLYEVGRTGPM